MNELISSTLGPYAAAVADAVARLQAAAIIPRIWDGDPTVWKPTPQEISNRLGWLHSPKKMYEQIDTLGYALIEAACANRYTHALLLGMGGSSLAPELFSKVFGAYTPRECEAGPRLALSVLDSTDPGAVLGHTAHLDPARTLFIVSTKSGGTVETFSFLKFFYNWTAETLGEDRAGEHFVAITDPGSGLATLAEEHAFRGVFLNDPNIGGRYSVLSYFGLVPAALCGVNVAWILERARAMATACGAAHAAADNPAAQLGAIMGALALAGRDKLTLVVSEALAGFGDWIEQLVAESTGKEGRGILPVVGEPLAAPEMYGADRVFVHLRLAGDKSQDTALAALEAAGHPVVRIQMEDVYDLGGQFFLWGLATAVAGHLLSVNPFDQPNVESAKIVARQMVKAYTETGALPDAPSAPVTRTTLLEFLAQAQPGDYIALQAYVHPTPETDAVLQALRVQLHERYRLATTVGYGPRFLHSTGQLHKGDRGNGLFIQFTSDSPQDAAIPDTLSEPESALTFGVLKHAQALGDQQALLDAGRRVIRFHLGEDVVGGLHNLI